MVTKLSPDTSMVCIPLSCLVMRPGARLGSFVNPADVEGPGSSDSETLVSHSGDHVPKALRARNV